MSDTIRRHLRQAQGFPTLEQEVFVGLQLAADRAMEPWARVLREAAGLTPVQYNLLRVLRGAGEEGRSVGEIGERLLTRSPDITRLIDRLVARGLVTRMRNPSDRRSMRIRITPTGIERIAPLDVPAERLIQDLFGPLGAERLESLRAGLGAVLDAVEGARSTGARRTPESGPDRGVMPIHSRRRETMAERKLIAVVGATGAQGGGLARAILEDDASDFAVRALTRNPDSDGARALADRGAEVVRADLDDVESLIAAFEGTYGAFCVTNYWELFSPEKEGEQVKNLAEAARRAGLRHVVWSTLEDTREWIPLEDDRMPTLMDRYKVPHFDGKGASDHYFNEAGVPTTFLRASFYWDNMIHFGLGPQRGEDGILRLTIPMGDKVLPGISAEDIGRCAYGIFREGPALAGEVIGVAGDHLTIAEMASAMSEALGEEVQFAAAVTPEIFRTFGFPGAEDLGNMFRFYQDFDEELAAIRGVERSRRLNPDLKDFRTWLEENASRLPVQPRA